mmetsp:Transcript_9473/g.17826  ORF Transcript_9473/g.17826 Transcript_9473/m.17826 type:complete len:945 (-) Transcript_9473:145-2979(-)|eukprot:CAMPEP_0176497560 /NCGR_PEP_ID=MMETSP0200_2-20121128/11787_1 /TAXON_ID=947934 /ORGANISM="Chaetoceros sp., Strain GSL56" /LENGTH=944 /DNA_ID=CAMNT_0017895577 /DNA_START=27 /DNA_END=2861 /DNA_ORIENTATION=-
MPHSHRASSLKQTNKSHKSGKASKRSINRSQGGKIQNRVSIKKKGVVNGSIKSKADRMHIAKQRRDASRDKLWQQKRVQGRLNVRNADTVIVPRIVGIVSLSDQEADLEKRVKDFLVETAEKCPRPSDDSSSVTVTYSKYKKEGHVTYLTNSTAFRAMYQNNDINDDDASVLAALDLSRICDTIIFLIDGRDADKTNNTPISGMNIGGGVSTTSASTAVQQDYDHLISSRGDRILSTIKAQGLPTPVTLLVNFEGDGEEETMSMASYQSMKSVRRSAIKKKMELKKYLTRFATTEFGEGGSKVMEIDIPSSEDIKDEMDDDNAKNVLIVGKSKKISPQSFLDQGTDAFPTRDAFIRALCTMNACPPKWVTDMPRAFIVSNDNRNHQGHTYDETSQELKITGFIRGKVPFDVNSLVHVPNVGTFGVKEILKTESPTTLKRFVKTTDEVMAEEASNVLAICDGDKREPLDMFANPDALEGEQNLIGFDDHDFNDDDGMDDKKENEGFARPAGWNDYQSAWLDAINDDDLSDEGIDHGELAAEFNKKKTDATVITRGDMDEEDDKFISEEEKRALIEQRKRDQKEDLDFPDEVQVGEDENARDRFARYRSLKSFRKSYWDPKENLPSSYASIFHFSSFRATQSDVMADMKDVMNAAEAQFNKLLENEKSKSDSNGDAMGEEGEDMNEDILDGCVTSGTYVTLVLEGVLPLAASRIDPLSLLTAVSLLPHENKASVIHMGLCENTQCDENEAGDMPIKSKDVIIFRCGWRTWQGRPIFSQNNLNCDKHKFERFMPTGGSFFACSVMGPVTYTPCPVLAFRKTSTRRTQFVALGSVIGADADRIVVKRIVLTGYPTRVHKRHATVKYMFYNPDDVKWFKPAELVTKHGLRGNITDSVGDHGTMKCLFNAPIKQHDTVCLHLYKRIYPKFAPVEIVAGTGETVTQRLLVL